MNTTNKILAIPTDTILKSPKTPAIIAMIRNINAQFNIPDTRFPVLDKSSYPLFFI
jgi:hypothetical protein